MPVKTCQMGLDPMYDNCSREATWAVGLKNGIPGNYCEDHARIVRCNLADQLMARYVSNVKLEIPVELQCATLTHATPRRATLALVLMRKGFMPVTVRACHNCILEVKDHMREVGWHEQIVVDI